MKLQSPVSKYGNTTIKLQSPISKVGNAIMKFQSPVSKIGNAAMNVLSPISKVGNAAMNVLSPISKNGKENELKTGFFARKQKREHNYVPKPGCQKPFFDRRNYIDQVINLFIIITPG